MLVFLLAAAGVWGAPSKKSKPASVKASKFDSEIKPLLSQYCYECHNDKRAKADLSLEMFKTVGDAQKNPVVWEKVLHNVRSGEMPPSKKPQPSLAERDKVMQWIETELLQADCSKPDPGRVTIRRLNRSEYNNTIRDLIGVNFKPADDFPADDTGYGFDNIGDVLSLPPVLFERYMTAAEKILNVAMVADPNEDGPTVRLPATTMRNTGVGQRVRSGAFKMDKEGEMFTEFNFPFDGSYIIRVRAWGEFGGDELPKLELKVNGNSIKTFEIAASEKEPAEYEHRFHVTAGDQRVSLGYINNYRDEKQDRNLGVEWLEVTGPNAPSVYPESHTRIFPREITPKTDKTAYAQEIIGNFAKRAFRRPLQKDELKRLMRFYELAQTNGERFEGSVKLALQAILVSPHFLFRGETQPDPNSPESIHAIDEFALASRLSYFLWSSTPDEELFALAEKKKLRKNLHKQVTRMLRDPKSEAFVQNFVGQWLQIRNLSFVQPDAKEFPDFDDELRQAMRKETELLFAEVLKQDRPVLELITADYSFLNERLARHYGVSGVKGREFQKIAFSNKARGGILTHGSVLTLTSNPTRTSPVKRGKYVLENILGTPPPPPPPEVPELKEANKEAGSGTLRQRMEQHRVDPGCASCHARMDPIGFGLENFNAVGAWREKEGEFNIDASGKLVSGQSFNGAAELKNILAEEKKDEFARCLTEKMLTYALGRGMEYYDKCAVDQISTRLRKSGYKFSELIEAIVDSTPFQKRRGETPAD